MNKNRPNTNVNRPEGSSNKWENLKEMAAKWGETPAANEEGHQPEQLSPELKKQLGAYDSNAYQNSVDILASGINLEDAFGELGKYLDKEQTLLEGSCAALREAGLPYSNKEKLEELKEKYENGNLPDDKDGLLKTNVEYVLQHAPEIAHIEEGIKSGEFFADATSQMRENLKDSVKARAEILAQIKKRGITDFSDANFKKLAEATTDESLQNLCKEFLEHEENERRQLENIDKINQRLNGGETNEEDLDDAKKNKGDEDKDEGESDDKGEDKGNEEDKEKDKGKKDNLEEISEDIEELVRYRDYVEERIERLKDMLAEIEDSEGEDGGETDETGGEGEGVGDDGEGDDEDPKPRPEALKPKLVGIDANLDEIAFTEAGKFADEAVNADIARSGFFMRIIKGGLLSQVLKSRYRSKLLRGQEKITYDNGEQVTLSEHVSRTQGAAQAALLASGSVDAAKFFQDGNRKDMHVNSVKTALVKDAIASFVDSVKSGQDYSAALNDFREKLHLNKQQAAADGEDILHSSYQNYEQVANQALELCTNELSIDQVLEDFKVYDAAAETVIHTKEHNTWVDEKVKYLEQRGYMTGAQVLAGATGIAAGLVSSGAKLFGFGVGVGAGAALAGLKAHQKTTADRAAMQINMATGRDYEASSLDDDEKPHGLIGRLRAHQANRTAKYERELKETGYNDAIENATDLAGWLKQSRESGDESAQISALAATQARIELSKELGIDLISYNSSESSSNEYLNLIIENAQSMQSLSRAEQDNENAIPSQRKLEVAKSVYKQQLLEYIEQQDQAFNKLRRKKTAAAAAGFAIRTVLAAGAVQEISGIFRKDMSSALSRMLGTDANDNIDAKQSFLDTVINGKREIHQSFNLGNKPTQQELEKYRQQDGWKVSQQPGKTVAQETTQQVSIDNARDSNVNLDYLDNRTRYSDGSELGGRGNPATEVFSRAHGVSTSSSGLSQNYDVALQEGRVFYNIRTKDALGRTKDFLCKGFMGQDGLLHAGNGNGVYELADGSGTLNLGNAPAAVSCVAVTNPSAIGTGNPINALSFWTETNYGGTGTASVTETIVNNITIPGDTIVERTINAATEFPGVFPPMFSQGNNLGRTYQAARPAPNPGPEEEPEEPTYETLGPEEEPEEQGTEDAPKSPEGGQSEGEQSEDGAPVSTGEEESDAVEEESSDDVNTPPSVDSIIQSITNSINSLNDSLGGDVRIRQMILEPDGDLAGQAGAVNERYDDWYNGLSERAQIAVREVYDLLSQASSDVRDRFNQSFFAWGRGKFGQSESGQPEPAPSGPPEGYDFVI